MYFVFHFLFLCLVPFFSYPYKGLALVTLLYGMMRLKPKLKIWKWHWPIFECITLFLVFTNIKQMPLGKMEALSVLAYFSNPVNLAYTCHLAVMGILLYQVFSRFSLWYRAVKQKTNFTILLLLYVGGLFWMFYSNFQKPVWIACYMLMYGVSMAIPSARVKRATHVCISLCWVFTGAISVIFVHNQIQRQSIRDAVEMWAVHENDKMDKTFDSWVNQIKNDSTLVNLISFLPQSDASLHHRIRGHLQLTRAVPYVKYAIFSKDGHVLVKASHSWLNSAQYSELNLFKTIPTGSNHKYFYKFSNDSCFYFIEFYVNAQYKFRLYYNPVQFNSLNDVYTAVTTTDSIENLLFNTANLKSAYFNPSGFLLGAENVIPQAFKTKYTCTLQSGSKWVFYELHSNFENVFFLVLSIMLCAIGIFFIIQLLYRGKTLYNAIKASLWHQNVWVATALISFFSAILLLLVYYQIEFSFESSQERQGIQLNQAIAQEFKSEFSQASVFDKTQLPLWSQFCNELQLRYSTPIVLYDATGKYIKMQPLPSHLKERFFPVHLNSNILIHAKAGFVLNTQAYPVYISNCSFMPDGSHIYIATLHVKDFAYQKQIKASMGNRCIHIFIVTVLLCIVLSSLINYQLTKPLRQLRQQLPLLSVEHTNSKIHIRGSGDLAQLIGAYNTLIDRLENNIEVLKLKEQSKAWKELALQVAHDIRNPLTPLKLNLQYLIQLQERDAQNFQQYFKAQAQQLVQQLDHMNAMVQRFSDFSKAEPLQLQPVQLVKLISTALAIVPNHVNVIWTTQLELPVHAEPQSVLRVLNNVLHNAIAAMDAVNEPVLEIVMYITPQKVLALEFMDNGKGISSEQQQQLFKFRFSSKTSGSGLGLMVSKELMVSMGGDLAYFKPSKLSTGFRLLFKV